MSTIVLSFLAGCFTTWGVLRAHKWFSELKIGI